MTTPHNAPAKVDVPCPVCGKTRMVVGWASNIARTQRQSCMACRSQPQREMKTKPPKPHLTAAADRVEDIEWLVDAGERHAEMIAKRVGISTRSIDKLLRRASRTDLLNRIQGAA